jgi:hypothetical protein
MTNDLSDALEQVSDPETYCRIPSIFGSAWERLKAARGQSVNFANIGEPAHRVEPATALTSRIRTYAKGKGYRLRSVTSGGGAA